MVDDATRAFLDHLHRGGAWRHLWWMPERHSRWAEVGAPLTIPGGSREIYYGVHPTTQIPPTNRRGETVPTEHVRSQTPFIAAVSCLFAEFDAKHFDGGKEAAYAHIESLEPAPSAVVDSGGGYHCYWLLTSSHLLASDAAREAARKTQAAWVTLVGGDPDSKDLCRVLRVPGTLNHKYDPPRPVQWVWLELDTTYAWDDLADMAAPFVEGVGRGPLPAEAGPSTTPVSARVAGIVRYAEEQVKRAGDGTKHRAVYRAAVTLGGVADLSQDDIETTILRALNGRQADTAHTLRTIRDGIIVGRGKPWDLERDRPGYVAAPRANGHAGAHLNGHAGGGQGAEAEPPATPAPDLLSEKLRAEFASLGYTFRLNELDDTIEVNGAPMTDVVRARLRVALRDRGWKGLTAAEDAWMAEAAANTFHPIRDYLTRLEWDGTPRVSAFCACLQSSDPPVRMADGRMVPLHEVYVRKWMLGAVGKVLHRVQNLMLVLAGEQGLGKSQLVRWLCSGIPDAHCEQSIIVGDKDSDVRQITRWIWEVAELDATTRKADVSALKGFITRDMVTIRRPYGRHDIHKPATASFIGTVNPAEGFLSDPTGNRRFLVTTITHVNWGYEDIDVDQLWAEVVADYHARRAEKPWELTPQEAEAQAVANRNHEIDSPVEGWLSAYFDLNAGPRATMSSAQIIDHLAEHYKVRLNGSPTAQAMEISRVMKRLGISRGRPSPSSPYVYYGVRGIVPASSHETYYNND
jgi:hypothetical protein